MRGKQEPRAKSEKKQGSMGGGLGMGLCEPLYRTILKNKTWHYSFWCIFEAII